jgi:molecular chaperone DnaJ
MTTTRDYYDILGVSKSATPEEIKKTFRRKAKDVHPDQNKSPEAEAEFKELGEAYNVLSDPEKRKVYDTYGHQGLQSGGYSTAGWDFMEGFPDLTDIFASVFGGGFSGGFAQSGRSRAARGEDIRAQLKLTFEESVFGVEKTLDVTRLIHCSRCTGSGAEPGTQPTTCATCAGNGQVRQTTQTLIGNFTQIATCPQCQGLGYAIETPCKQCHGFGRHQHTDKIEITIPPGVDDGTRLRVAAEGDAGLMGASAGDLYVVLSVGSHAMFRREGYNLTLTVPVSYVQLVLGGEITVAMLKPLVAKSPNDKAAEKKPFKESPSEVVVKIQPGTPSGFVARIREAGVPHLQNPFHRGDLLVTLVVNIPKNPSLEEKRLLQQLAELHQVGSAEKKTHEEDHPSLFGRFRDVISGGGH